MASLIINQLLLANYYLALCMYCRPIMRNNSMQGLLSFDARLLQSNDLAINCV